MIGDAVGVVEDAQRFGYSLFKCNNSGEADALVGVVESMLKNTDYGVLRVRECEVNVFTYSKTRSKEDCERILRWHKNKMMAERVASKARNR